MFSINRYYNSIVILLGGLVFMILALYNGYPIVTNDTGAYISSGFELSTPIDRPIFYGLFIHATSLGMSLWLTIYAQCLLLSYVYLRFIIAWIPGMPKSHKIFFLIYASLCTIGGWYASQLMPDIFVAIMIMSALVFLKREGSRKERIIMILLCFISLITHNSNYITLTLFSILLLAGSFIFKWIRHIRWKATVLLGTSLIAWLVLCTSNFLGKKEFIASNATHVFIMGKLVESGVLKTYLDKACPVYNYGICAYKDSLPYVAWGFVWDEKSPLQKTGGWDANRQEYNKIINDIVGRPKYWPYLMFKSGEATLRQLVLINIDGVFELKWIRYLNESPPFENINKFFPHEINEFSSSKENNNSLDIGFMNSVFCVCLVTSLLIVVLLNKIGISQELKSVSILLFLLILLNAFTTATFANVLTRLNSRVIWLIPILNAMYIYKYFSDLISVGSKTFLSASESNKE